MIIRGLVGHAEYVQETPSHKWVFPNPFPTEHINLTVMDGEGTIWMPSSIVTTAIDITITFAHAHMGVSVAGTCYIRTQRGFDAALLWAECQRIEKERRESKLVI